MSWRKSHHELSMKYEESTVSSTISLKNLRPPLNMSKLKLSDLVVVTTNKDKLAEINEILGTNHKVSKNDITEIQSLDLDEVIADKAKKAYQIVKKPVLVEDVSLEIKSLSGLPGPLVKFFDKVFIPKGYRQTFAQMPPEIKNQISHRAKALRKIKAHLTS